MTNVDTQVLIRRLVAEAHLRVAEASIHVQEYLRFLELKAIHEDWMAEKLSPSGPIDRVWHLHILDTIRYKQECIAACGKMIHHNPDGPREENRQKRYQATLTGYCDRFGVTPPAELWPADDGIMNATVSKRRAEESKGTIYYLFLYLIRMTKF
jgi:hypothetical protein